MGAQNEDVVQFPSLHDDLSRRRVAIGPAKAGNELRLRYKIKNNLRNLRRGWQGEGSEADYRKAATSGVFIVVFSFYLGPVRLNSGLTAGAQRVRTYAILR